MRETAWNAVHDHLGHMYVRITLINIVIQLYENSRGLFYIETMNKFKNMSIVSLMGPI